MTEKKPRRLSLCSGTLLAFAFFLFFSCGIIKTTYRVAKGTEEMDRRSTLLALILIITGAYFIFVKVNLLPSVDLLWPIFPFAGGMALLVGYLLGSSKSS